MWILITIIAMNNQITTNSTEFLDQISCLKGVEKMIELETALKKTRHINLTIKATCLKK